MRTCRLKSKPSTILNNTCSVAINGAEAGAYRLDVFAFWRGFSRCRPRHRARVTGSDGGSQIERSKLSFRPKIVCREVDGSSRQVQPKRPSATSRDLRVAHFTSHTFPYRYLNPSFIFITLFMTSCATLLLIELLITLTGQKRDPIDCNNSTAWWHIHTSERE